MSNTTLFHVGLAFVGIAAIFLMMERILMGPAAPRSAIQPSARQPTSGLKLVIVILLTVAIGVLTAVSLWSTASLPPGAA